MDNTSAHRKVYEFESSDEQTIPDELIDLLCPRLSDEDIDEIYKRELNSLIRKMGFEVD